MRARRVVAAVFAIALAVGAPTSITLWHHSTTAAHADVYQPVTFTPTGGYPGTYEPVD